MGNFNSRDPPKFPLKTRSISKYGCIPDIPDQRDIVSSIPNGIKYFSTVDLRKHNFFPPVGNQGEIGSAVAHTLIAAYVYSLRKDKININIKELSAQFIYYNQRVISGTVDYDSGSSIRDGLKVLERIGVCDEINYPYNIMSYREKPTDEAYRNAFTSRQIVQYRRIKPSLEDIMRCLSVNIPVIMGFTAYESFQHQDVGRTGVMPVPKLGEKIAGYHVCLLVGYDIPREFFLCRNSAGSTWGQGGYFWAPFQFMTERNFKDLWIISTGSNSKPVVQNVQKINGVPPSQPPKPSPNQSQPSQRHQPIVVSDKINVIEDNNEDNKSVMSNRSDSYEFKDDGDINIDVSIIETEFDEEDEEEERKLEQMAQ